MTSSTLRVEVFGQNGFAAKLRGLILSPQRLAATTQQQVLAAFPSGVNCGNVNDVLCALLDGDYKTYLALEQQAFERVAEVALQSTEYPNIYRIARECRLAVCDQNLEPDKRVARVGQLLAPLYKLVSESFAQSRKARAGGSAQYHVAYVLDQLGYKGKYEMQCVLNGTVDFLFPSLAAWKADRRSCTILSIKRTLRERYKQIYQELNITGGLTVYLMVTAPEDETQRDIPESKVQKLEDQNVYLIVRDQIKAAYFAQRPTVRSFTDFFCTDLPRLSQFWVP